MFKRILIASDLSAASNELVKSLSNFKSLGVEEVILFYACGVRHLDAVADLIKNSLEPYLIGQLKMIQDQGFNATLEIAPGIPSEEIKRVSKQKNVSLIVIGTHGESAASHIFFRFGGVTSEVLHSHEKPLLLIRTNVLKKEGKIKDEDSTKNLKERILYATDFSDISLDAFLHAEKLVEDGCKKLTLIHVQDKGKIGKHLFEKLGEFNRIDGERMEILKNQLLSKGAEHVEIKIIYGIPAKEILEESRKGYSLIIMGSQGQGFFHEVFLGSVSHTVARNADVSLLLIPAIER